MALVESGVVENWILEVRLLENARTNARCMTSTRLGAREGKGASTNASIRDARLERAKCTLEMSEDKM